MKKNLVLFCMVVWTLTGFAQTNILTFSVGDYGLRPQSRVGVTLTLIWPNPRTVNGVLIRQDPISNPTGTNGQGSFTNIIWGKYRVDVAGAFGTSYIAYVGTNTLGTVPLASLITNSAALPPNDGTNYYTRSQVDALIAGLSASGTATTNVFWGTSTNLSNASSAIVIWVYPTNGVPYSLVYTNL